MKLIDKLLSKLNLEKKLHKNTKIQSLIKKDGQTHTKFMLSINDKRKREEIIVEHFRKGYEHLYGIKIPSKLLERDNPHDFTFVSSNGDKYFLEIVAISDSTESFINQSTREALENKFKKENNSLIFILPNKFSKKDIDRALEVMEGFPITKKINIEQIRFLINTQTKHQKPIILKIHNRKKERIFFTRGNPNPLVDIIKTAVLAKECKKYKYMNQMILLLDNQTIHFTIKDFENEWIKLVKMFAHSHFKEIFLYTGYYSGDNGREAEFNLLSLKTKHDPRIEKIVSSS